MAENNNNGVTETDIFQQQKKTIDTLIDVLERQGGQQAETVYVQPPGALESAKPPNYLMYVAIGSAVLFLLFKR